MALPREVHPDRWYMVTRRCAQRELLLRPDAETNEVFTYCLAVAAERTGIGVSFAMACANHHHTGIHDPSGTFPAFLEYFHGLVARCMNALRGRWENFWASEQASVVELVTADDVLAKAIYALSNPVKDGLVERAHQWPGASTLRATLTGRAIVASRPRHFFSEEGSMPERATLRLVHPLEFTRGNWVESIERGIAAVEARVAAERRKTGHRVLGRAGVLKQRWRSRPRLAAPRRRLSPRVASLNKWARVAALQRRKAFLAAYRRARSAFMSGVDLIAFPPGTYWRLKPDFIPRAWLTS